MSSPRTFCLHIDKFWYWIFPTTDQECCLWEIQRASPVFGQAVAVNLAFLPHFLSHLLQYIGTLLLCILSLTANLTLPPSSVSTAPEITRSHLSNFNSLLPHITYLNFFHVNPLTPHFIESCPSPLVIFALNPIFFSGHNSLNTHHWYISYTKVLFDFFFPPLTLP